MNEEKKDIRHFSNLMKDVTNKDIEFYLNCMKCVNEIPENERMIEYSRLSVGATADGLVLWCERHQHPVVHLPYDWIKDDRVKKCEGGGCKE